MENRASTYIDSNNKVAIFTHMWVCDVLFKWQLIYSGGALHSG